MEPNWIPHNSSTPHEATTEALCRLAAAGSTALTVGELRAKIEALPDDAVVHLADEEAAWEATGATVYVDLGVLSLT